MDTTESTAAGSGEPELFETNQIHMAVFLMCRGHQPVGPGRKEGKKVFFQFADKAACEVLKVACLVGDDTVSARQYEANFKTLKHLIYGD